MDTVQASTPAPIPLVGVDEIHDLIVRISREHVRELTYRDGFPEPAAELAGGDVWFRADIEAWICDNADAVAELLRSDRQP